MIPAAVILLVVVAAIVGGSIVIGAPVFAIPIVAVILLAWGAFAIARRAGRRTVPRERERVELTDEDRATTVPTPSPRERAITRRRTARGR